MREMKGEKEVMPGLLRVSSVNEVNQFGLGKEKTMNEKKVELGIEELEERIAPGTVVIHASGKITGGGKDHDLNFLSFTHEPGSEQSAKIMLWKDFK